MNNARFAIKMRVAVVAACMFAVTGLILMAFLGHEPSITSYHVNVYGAVSAVAALLNVALLIYFIGRPSRSEERGWLAFYILGMALYIGTFALQEMSTTPQAALFWSGFGNLTPFFAPALALFALTYTNQTERRYPGIMVMLLFAAMVISFFESFTNYIYVNDYKLGVLQPWGYDFRAVGASGIYVVLLFYLVVNTAAIAHLLSFRRHTRNDVLRRQSLLFTIAVATPTVAGILLDALLPSFGFDNLPPFSALFGVPAAFILVYGEIKYKLTDINPAVFSNTILAIIQDSVVVTDKQFTVLFLNGKAEGLLGITNERASRMSLKDLVVPNSRKTFEQAFLEGSKDTIDIEHVDISTDGTVTTPVHIMASPFKFGDTQTWVMALSDITRELQTRSVIEHEVAVRTEELNQARAYLVSSINSLEQGFILVNRNSKVELANGVAARLFQSPAADASGKHLIEFVKPLAWNVDLSDVVHKVLDARKHRQLQAASDDGSFYEVYVTPVLSGDRELGATIIIQDVTEQKILDRSKDEFFSIASHELRTPLTAIRGNMSMLKDYFPDAMKDESLAAMVDDTHAASIRLIEIVSDFLDSSKLEQGKMVFNLAPQDVLPMVEAVVKDLEPILKSRGNTVKIDDGLGKLPKVNVDEGRYRQVVYNLLSNATKYSEHATITVTADHDAKSVTLHIADTGKGISPENQKLLFHKFQQAGDTLTRDDTKGTGLGLYISKLLATHMGGDVFLEHTEEGKGSVFGVKVSSSR